MTWCAGHRQRKHHRPRIAVTTQRIIPGREGDKPPALIFRIQVCGLVARAVLLVFVLFALCSRGRGRRGGWGRGLVSMAVPCIEERVNDAEYGVTLSLIE